MILGQVKENQAFGFLFDLTIEVEHHPEVLELGGLASSFFFYLQHQIRLNRIHNLNVESENSCILSDDFLVIFFGEEVFPTIEVLVQEGFLRAEDHSDYKSYFISTELLRDYQSRFGLLDGETLIAGVK